MAGRGTDIQLGGNLDMRVAQELADVTDEKEREKRIEQIFDADRESDVIVACSGVRIWSEFGDGYDA